ncbi:ATP-binding cassette domain-containing protein [Streptomyces sp. SP17BM10]|uniref:ATP-binding cassette domain-containing protein n=1 Tax=Streptomyces sp. SP17BM10 TaxID=3002530 RepID=UPI002E76034D|nr:ATP-binding cassette domain-containing protein [Streptomyces sp. SP17BM10]MEE1781829.1 ATP-binding cassette domain-containing protein [Streptomyces sp. SP17BM10]
MIQITGLTKVRGKGAPPVLLDLTFDARPGLVTALLGPEGAGKSTALRLMVELERGQGVTLFHGRTYRRLRRPEREVGVLLQGRGEGHSAVAGHPGRTARGQLRMLAAAVGVPTRRADELLEQTRLATVAGQRLRTFSPGMHRRLALAAALLGDPGTLLLDAPTDGLSPRNVEWFHAFLRSFAVAGGTVLVTTRTPQEASQLADRVITLDRGRLVADQPVAEFRRTRLSPEVAVRGPQMARLADLLASQGAQVRRDGGAGLAVAGIGRTEIGELAYRHGILLHELADRVVEQPAPKAVLPAASGRSGQIHVQPKPADGRKPATRPQASVEPAEQGGPTEVVEQAEPQGDAALPTRALPTAHLPTAHLPAASAASVTSVTSVTSVATALSALAVAGATRERSAEPPPTGGPSDAYTRSDECDSAHEPAAEPVRSGLVPKPDLRSADGSATTVAVDRPFRTGPAAPAALLSDDTVRLGRVTSEAAPSISATATPDDLRSE